MILFFYLCLGLSILLTSVAQILLKIGASKKNSNESVYLNRTTISGYGLLVVVTVLSVLALKGIELKVFYAAAYALNFILVAIFSWKFLGEPLSRKKVAGILLIALGILVFNM
jgi:Membrane transporters of cations and cationic drugs